MTIDNHSKDTDPHLRRLRQIDKLADDFEKAWRAEQKPRLEDYLERPDFDGSQTLFRECLAVEVANRVRLGEFPSIDEYHARFPKFAKFVEEFFAGEATQRGEAQPLKSSAKGDESSSLGESMTKDRVVGKYRLIEKIGEGGMGSVWKAEHTLVKRTVALKVLRADVMRDKEAVRRFLQEAQLSLKLGHRHVVRTIDVDQDGDLIYLTMDLVRGENLDSLVRRLGPLSPGKAASIIQQAAEGLAYAHRKRIVHRDVKPQNIMLNEQGDAQILDMGLARFIAFDEEPPSSLGPNLNDIVDAAWSRLTLTGAMMGTIAYMAPEQAVDPRLADARSDVYSLGATFYFLLTGKAAFAADDARATLQRHFTGEYTPLSSALADVPAQIEQICHRMMALEPVDRYQTGDEIVAELKGWLHCSAENPQLQEIVNPSQGFNLGDFNGLGETLVSLGLIGPNEWTRAMEPTGRTIRSERTTSAVGPEPTAIEALLRLERSGPAEDATRGLTKFQVQNIVSGRAKSLRLPNHVLLERINEGWKGELFLARRLPQRRIETVRVLNATSLSRFGRTTRERVEGFIAHAKKLTELSSPHFGAILEVGRAGETAYLASDFVRGVSLHDHWTKRGAPGSLASLAAALEIAGALAAALEYLHDQNTLHLDVNPHNVRWTQEGSVKLFDPGLALLLIPKKQDVSGSLSPRPTVGPAVVPPEFLFGNAELTPAADVYILGETFRFLRTGKFDHRPMKLLEAAPRQDTAELSSMPAESPPRARPKSRKKRTADDAFVERSSEFLKLIGAMTTRHPILRPQNAKAVLGELAGLREHLLKDLREFHPRTAKKTEDKSKTTGFWSRWFRR